MDSSRSGLLSTLLMTLPMIVVPAIALLRPPGQPAGISTSPLDAADTLEDELFSEFDVTGNESRQPKKSAETSSRNLTEEFDGLFDEEPAEIEDSGGRNSVAEDSSSFNPFDNEDEDWSEEDRSTVQDETASPEKIVEQLNMRGALRTMWFEAGAKTPVGFAVFFRGETELMRIRFEAVGRTRPECAQKVLEQVEKWQAEQAREER